MQIFELVAVALDRRPHAFRHGAIGVHVEQDRTGIPNEPVRPDRDHHGTADSGHRVHECARIMVDVTTILEITTGAWLPEALIDHAPQEAIKDRVVWLVPVGELRI